MSGLSDMGIARKRDSSPQLVPNTVISTEAQRSGEIPVLVFALALAVDLLSVIPEGDLLLLLGKPRLQPWPSPPAIKPGL